MTSDPLKDRKKLLAMRKKKLNRLVDDIESHETEHEDAMHHNKGFMDPKYTTSTSLSTVHESEPSTENPSSAVSSMGRFSTLFETDADLPPKKTEKKGPDKLTVSAPNPKLKTILAPPSSATFKTDTDASSVSINASSRKSPHPKSKSKKLAIKESEPEVFNELEESSNFSLLKGIMKPAPKLSDLFRDGDIKVRVDDDDSEFEEQSFKYAVEALENLENLNFIFMQRVLDYTELEAAGVSFRQDTVDLAYQILNLQGNILFLMEQHKIKCSTFIVFTRKSFENVLYDISGTKVLKFIGPSVFMSKMISKMLITDSHERTLGYVKPFGKKCNYSVYNSLGERLFLVVSNVYIPSPATTFTVLCGGQKIGVIKYGWKHTFHDFSYIDYETAGVELPPDLDERGKALILGCMVLIEFSWYSPMTKLKLSMLLVGLLLVGFAVILIIIPLVVDRSYNYLQTQSYYTADQT